MLENILKFLIVGNYHKYFEKKLKGNETDVMKEKYAPMLT